MLQPDLSSYWVFDIETFPNYFCAVFQNFGTGQRMTFELSEFEDHSAWLWPWLMERRMDGSTFIGFNSLNFDYPVLHLGMTTECNYPTLYAKAQAIIDAPRGDWTHSMWESDHLIPQIDLFKIMHFDNMARSTSLKKLEIAMRSPHVEDIPVKPATPVPAEWRRPVLDYCAWDVSETARFAHKIWDRIEFRQQLDATRGGRSRINFNDTRIGKNLFLEELEKAGIATKEGRNPRQTPRTEGIHVADILLPMEFDSPDLQRIYSYFHGSIIPPANTKGYFTDLHADLDGFKLDFGAGGIHASVSSETHTASEDRVIIDADVTSYYPSLAIEYGWYPEHLGPQFVDIYRGLKEQRLSYKKGTPENASLKLALNGTYGESNNKYSSFYDPQFTMSITINGQLLLARLMEVLMRNDDVVPIQMNTDGLTISLPRKHLEWYYSVCDWWQQWSRMDLEFVEYAKMAIRDVNNYLAIDTDGKVKRKGAYDIDPDYHQDHSSLVIPRAVSAHVETGEPLADFIYRHDDPFDFIRSVKVPRNSRLEWGNDTVQNVTRYYVALQGKPLTKIMPPLRGKTDEREIGIDKGWFVQVVNDINHWHWDTLNRPFYLQEAQKLLKGLGV